MLPFEEEIGLHPTIEAMQDAVVEKKLRPKIRGEWRAHKVIASIFALCGDLITIIIIIYIYTGKLGHLAQKLLSAKVLLTFIYKVFYIGS